MLDLSINPTILTFDDSTKELEGSTFREKLNNYHTPHGCTYMTGIVERLINYLSDAPNGQKICILFITDGAVYDLAKITPFLLTCVEIIIHKKLSVYMSCVAIDSSADMKAFSLLGLLNNFSVFQLVQSKNGDGWTKQVMDRFKETETCKTSTYSSGSASDFIYSDIVVDSKVCEKSAYNKVYLATLVQAFTICNFESPSEGFMMCKRLLKYIADLGVNEKTRYIWTKLNTAKMVSDKNSNLIANEFISTINDCNTTTSTDQGADQSTDQGTGAADHHISIVNEHDVRVRLFVGKTKSFTQCLPISINEQNQIIIQSEGLNELYLNVEVYHPNEPVDLEISFGDSKHRWYIPYGVSLIEGDTKYLMLAHEKLKPASGNNHEKMFDFIIKAVPSSLKTIVQPKPRVVASVQSRVVASVHEKMFDFIKAVPSSLKTIVQPKPRVVAPVDETIVQPRPVDAAGYDYLLGGRDPRVDTNVYGARCMASAAFDLFDRDDNDNSRCYTARCIAPAKSKPASASAKAFATVSKETRKIDTVKREHQISSDAHVLCFSFVFVYDTESSEGGAIEIIFKTKECVICLENDSVVKFKCNHQCICSPCYDGYIDNIKKENAKNYTRNKPKCPMCRQLI